MSHTEYLTVVGGGIDIPEVTELVTAAETAIDGTARSTESYLRMLIRSPDVDGDRSVVSARDAETGALAGFALFRDPEPHIESITMGWVHPSHRGKGLATALVRWGLETALDRIHTAPPEARVTNRCQASDADTAASEVFATLGYAPDRHDLEMERIFAGSIEVAPLPTGITVRNLSRAADIASVARVTTEAFKDHYGWVESSWDQTLEQWANYRSMDDWDDDLVFIAEAAGEPVGVLVGVRTHGARSDIGYIASLGVVRGWRRKGLARALLTLAFARYQARGMRGVALEVDADSLTGATRIYRGVGMEPVRSETAYLIELRPGIDLVKR